MKKTVYCLLTFALSANLYASDLNGIKAADIKDQNALDLPAPAAAQAAPEQKTGKAYNNVYMFVNNNPSWKQAEANDYSNRIEARVRQISAGQYDVSLRTDLQSDWGTIYKNSANYYNLSGNGMYLSMSEFGGNYSISGNVTGPNNQNKYIYITLYKSFDETSFTVSGGGIYLSINKNSINGNFDDQQYSKKAIASIISLALAVQVEKTPAAKSAALKQYDQRIWLSIGPGFGGWNTVEASDPFSRIEVGLRKIFDGEYDAEMTTDNSRDSGRVSHFFTSRYEFRGGRTDLRIEEWAGSYTVQGNVAVDGAPNGTVSVKLEMRQRFDAFSFYIQQPGIYLIIDKNAINGEVDTKVYPKQVVAAITALVMAMQQEAPGQQAPEK